MEGFGGHGGASEDGPGSRPADGAASASPPIGFDPSRERDLQVIGDVIEYWIKWVTRNHGGLVTPDTSVILGLENAPPHWPSVGQLAKWLEVIRLGPGSEGMRP